MGFIYRVYTFIKENDMSCNFFDGFGLFVQFLLGIICFSILIIKRYTENPMRGWDIWFLDSSKQIFGQFTQHMLNLFIAHRIGKSKGLECEWYMNNLIVDATLGVFINYVYLKCLEKALANTSFSFDFGNYGDKEVKLSTYFYQLWIWLTVVILSKFTCLGFILVLYQLLENFAQMILFPIKYNVQVKLVFVMIIIPMIFNALQFWVTDNIIKKDSKEANSGHSLEGNHSCDKEAGNIHNLSNVSGMINVKKNGQLNYNTINENVNRSKIILVETK